MRMINFLVAVFFLFATSCSEDEPRKKTSLKDKLIGEWIEISPCDSCNVFTFSQNDTIYQKSKSDDTIYRLFFQTINNDSILVTRIWDIEQNKKTTKHKILFFSDNSLMIKQFTPVDFGTTGFEDIKLNKTE